MWLACLKRGHCSLLLARSKRAALLCARISMRDACSVPCVVWFLTLLPSHTLQVIEDYKEKLQLRTDHHMG